MKIFSALTRKSFADVTRRPGRTILVILGILISVFGLSAVNFADSALGAAISYSHDTHLAPDIQFLVDRVSPSLASQLASVPNVQTVQFESTFSSRWRTTGAGQHVNIDIIGYADFRDVRLNTFQLTSGHLPGKGEIVLESSDRALSSFAVGDTITVEAPQGAVGLRVVESTRTIGALSAGFPTTALAYMSQDGLSSITGMNSMNTILIKASHTSDNRLHETARALAAVLHKNGVTVLNVRVVSDVIGASTISGILLVLRMVSLIALLLTSFLIINTMTTLVAEQTKVIGIMKAVGGIQGKILRSYLVSVGIYGAIGTTLGIGLGIAGGSAIATFIANIITIDLGSLQVPPGAILTSVLVGMGIPLLAALFPLWRGTRITVREAMAAYGVNSGGKQPGLFSRVARVPQTTLLGVRGLFRRRGRAILTLLALTLSGATFLAVQTTNGSVDGTITQLFNTYSFDVSSFTIPHSYSEMRTQVMALPNVARVEPIVFVEATTPWGVIEMTGLQPDTQLYHRQLISGRWFNANDTQALVISDAAASKGHLQVGDRLTFSSATNTASWKIIGIVHDVSNAGPGSLGAGLTNFANLNAFDGRPADLTTGLMIQAKDHTQSAVDLLANRVDETLSRLGVSPTTETQQQHIQRNQGQLQIIAVLLDAVAVNVALVGILGLPNTLTTSVLERRREIGILRSLGARGRQVAGVFWIEGMAFSLIAWIVAVLLGIPGAYVFVKLLSAVLLEIDFSFNPLTLVALLGFMLLVATVASIAPALGASRMRIAEVIRYE